MKVKVPSPDELSAILKATRGRENKNNKYVFYLGFNLGASKKKDKVAELRAILAQKRFWD